MAKTVLLTESLSFIINLDGIYLLGYAWLFGMCKFGSILVETTAERLLSSVDYILWRLVARSASPISSLTGRRRCDRLSDSSYVFQPYCAQTLMAPTSSPTVRCPPAQNVPRLLCQINRPFCRTSCNLDIEPPGCPRTLRSSQHR